MNTMIVTFSKLIKNNKFLLAASFVIAVILWFYVVGVYYPESTLNFKDIPLNVSLSGTAPESSGLMLQKGAPKTVSVVLKGARTDLATLQKDKIKAALDLNAIINPGTYDLPVKITLPSGELQVVSVSPSQVTAVISKKVTSAIDVKVNVNGNVKEGFIADTPKAYPSSLNLTGPEEIIAKIKYVLSEINVADQAETVVRKSGYIFVDTVGNTVSSADITADFEQITVTAPVLKSKTIPLSVNIINGSGGFDSKFVNVQISPAVVLIAGNIDIIDTVNSIEICTVDMSDIPNEGFTQEYDIQAANGVKILDNVKKATVTVTYPEIITKTFQVKNFIFINTPAGRTASPVSSSVTITIRGIPADIGALNADNIKANVDLSNVTTTGRVQCNLTFELPADINAGVFGKYTASIKIK